MRQNSDSTLSFSPTDLTIFSACRHASFLDILKAEGRPLAKPEQSPHSETLAELGRRFEQAYVDSLRESGKRVVEIGGYPDDPVQVQATIDAMKQGVDYIVQAPLRSETKSGTWRGIADVLRKVDAPSNLGNWSYEPVDTKLAKTTKAGAIVQLTLYALWLEEIQGTQPEHLTVVSPGATEEDLFVEQTYRVDDSAAYVRRLRRDFESFIEDARTGNAETIAEQVDHCQVCSWWRHCDTTWRAEDNLVLVANLGRAHRTELKRHDIDTVAELATLETELGFRPDHGSPAAYLSAAHQAKMQVASRESGRLEHDLLLPVENERGFTLLPEPSPFDLFFDLEGDPFFGLGGLEYLWGWADVNDDYHYRWALDKHAEQQAFEEFMDLMLTRWRQHPEMRVYHYGPYETSALKRLMSIYGSRIEELDDLLRGKVFVDLLQVTRQAARIGVERYSLKDLERLHGYVREADLRSVGPHKRALEHGLMLGEVDEVPEESREKVLVYNKDDVVSTARLRDWLEERRAELVDLGHEVARPEPGTDPSEQFQAERTAAMETIDALRSGLPEDQAIWSREDEAKALLADLIDFERREDKVVYWEQYALRAMEADELENSPKGIAGLEFVGQQPGGTPARPIHRYRFPPQELDVRSKDDFWAPVEGEWVKIGDELEVDPSHGTLDMRKVGKWRHVDPESGYFWTKVNAAVVAKARLEFAQDILDHGLDSGLDPGLNPGLDAPGRFRTSRDLLLRIAGRGLANPPRAQRLEGESTLEAAIRMASGLDGGVLPVQGPPGAGKSYTGAHVILDFVRRGKKVGVTAVSSKVVAHLLTGIAKQAEALGEEPPRMHHRATNPGDVPACATHTKDYAALLGHLESSEAKVVGGTAWLWSRPEFRESIDLLVIDEAGQMSLAMALSVATAAKNVLLLGDPQQLDQPIQATHPEGADVAVLRHMMGEHKTVQDGDGLFLDRTYRLAPSIAKFTSELAYEGRLEAIEANERIALSGTDGFDGAGLSYWPVRHEGRSGTAPEEVEAVVEIIDRLLQSGAQFRDNEGELHPLEAGDVLVVAPFNRHVEAIGRKVPPGVRVGTVDRFQGQEAPVVIYAMGVSSADLAPRGLGFLFSTERFNVATSRAKALVVLVASDTLFDTVCRTPEEIRLVNGHVRLLEMAEKPGRN